MKTDKTDNRIGILLGLSLTINGILIGLLVELVTVPDIIYGLLLGGLMPLLMVLGMCCMLVFSFRDDSG